MRFLTILVVAALCIAPRAWAQAQALPDLGDVSGGALSARMERRVGESIAREIRYRDPQTGKVETALGWFHGDVRNIGVTSGASTPDVTLLEIIQRLLFLKRGYHSR